MVALTAGLSRAAIARPDAIQPALDALLAVVDEVFPVEQVDVEKARDVLLGMTGLSARDALRSHAPRVTAGPRRR